MKVGITGHQRRPSIDWSWVRYSLRQQIEVLDKPVVGLSSLAEGADQEFAESILHNSGTLISVIPCDGYRETMSSKIAHHYDRLVSLSGKIIIMPNSNNKELSFFNAGKYIVDQCDIIFAVWDGKPSVGFGGTADVVHYAELVGRPIVHFDILKKNILRLTR